MEKYQQYVCPITKQIFADSVVAADGNMYEREAIEEWFVKKQTSPLTNEQIVTTLLSVIMIKQEIDKLIENDSNVKEQV